MLGATIVLTIHFLLIPSPVYSQTANQRPTQSQTQPCENEKQSFLWRVRRKGPYPYQPAYLFGTIHVPYSVVWDSIPPIVKHYFRVADVAVFELDLTDPYTMAALKKCQFLPQGQRLNETLPASMYTRIRNYLDYVKSVMPQWIGNSYMANDFEYQYGLANLTWTSHQRTVHMSKLSNSRTEYANHLFHMLTYGWEYKRPIWIMLLLTMLNENELKYRDFVVLDVHLTQVAQQNRKVLAAIERVEEQCNPLNQLNKTQAIFALNVTLSHLEFGQRHGLSMNESMLRAWRNPTEQLVRKYKCGNVRELVTTQQLASHVSVSGLDDVDQRLIGEVDNYFVRELIFKRNVKMAERVQNFMTANPNKMHFFAFGAGHLVGNRTVLELLSKAGYIIEHVPFNTTLHSIRRTRPPRNASVVTRGARKRATAAPMGTGQKPVDLYSKSGEEANGQARVSGQIAGSTASRAKNTRVGSGTSRYRQGGELMDYLTYWETLLDATTPRVASSHRVTEQSIMHLSLQPQVTPTATISSTPRSTPQAHTQTIGSELLELMRRSHPIRRHKLDESKVIDIGDDENESRRNRARSNSAAGQCDTGLLLSTCISIIIILRVIRYRRIDA